MATRIVPMDRDTPLLLPPHLRDWVPADPLVHFILDAVDAPDLRQVRVNTRGPGSAPCPPRMLLWPCSPRASSKSCNWPSTSNGSKVGQLTVAADGPKVLAHASQHSAVSYARAGEMVEQLKLEVPQLLAKAGQADATPLQDGLSPKPEGRSRKAPVAAAGPEALFPHEGRSSFRPWDFGLLSGFEDSDLGHQVGAGVSAIAAARTGESGPGMDAGVPGLQIETAAPAGGGPETGGSALKKSGNRPKTGTSHPRNRRSPR